MATPAEISRIRSELFSINVEYPAGDYPATWSLGLVSNYDDKGLQINNIAKSTVTLIDYVNDFAPLNGTGTPEGVVTSNNSKTYYRIDGSTTETYFNPNVGAITGWVLI